MLYDNTTLAVAWILGDGERQRTRAFTHLQSHYLFRDHFGRPGTHHLPGVDPVRLALLGLPVHQKARRIEHDRLDRHRSLQPACQPEPLYEATDVKL